MIKRVIYVDKESKEYVRSFSTTAVINANPNKNVVVDFYEEYLQPYLLVKQEFEDSGEKLHTHDEEEIIINREKKVSVVMTKETALRMAEYILHQYGEGDEPNDSN